MKSIPTREDFIPAMASARWQRGADRLGRYAWRLLLVAVAIGLAGGLVAAAVARPGIADAPVAAAEACTDPPCLSLDLDRIRLSDIPTAIAST